jgi:hypothetical protein
MRNWFQKFDKLQIHEKLLYVSLWLLVFIVPVIGTYYRSTAPDTSFDWSLVFRTWKDYVPFLFLFVVHDWLIAPFLVNDEKKAAYFGIAGCALLLFAFYIWNQRPSFDSPPPQQNEVRTDMRPSMPPFAQGDVPNFDSVPPPPRGEMQDGNRPPVRPEERPEAGNRPPFKPDGNMDNPPAMREDMPPMREKYTKLLIAALMMGVNLGIKLYFRQRRDANNLVDMAPLSSDVPQPATADVQPSSSATVPTVDEDSHIIFVKSEYRMVRIDIRQIRYVEAMSEYLRLYLEGEAKPIIALLSMKRLEERLPQNFMRVHRSYIVNLQKIQQIERGRIVMDKDTYIPVSEGYKEAFNRFLSEKSLEK